MTKLRNIERQMEVVLEEMRTLAGRCQCVRLKADQCQKIETELARSGAVVIASCRREAPDFHLTPTLDFVTALNLAKEAYAKAESMQIHPLKNTHTNDVPVIAAKLLCDVVNGRSAP